MVYHVAFELRLCGSIPAIVGLPYYLPFHTVLPGVQETVGPPPQGFLGCDLFSYRYLYSSSDGAIFLIMDRILMLGQNSALPSKMQRKTRGKSMPTSLTSDQTGIFSIMTNGSNYLVRVVCSQSSSHRSL